MFTRTEGSEPQGPRDGVEAAPRRPPMQPGSRAAASGPPGAVASRRPCNQVKPILLARSAVLAGQLLRARHPGLPFMERAARGWTGPTSAGRVVRLGGAGP